MKAIKPDYRDRFGGSFAGSKMMLEKYQRIGFGWTRWFPETKWQFFQPRKGDPFDWHDVEFELSARYGVSQHVVLYGWPEGLMDSEHSGQMSSKTSGNRLIHRGSPTNGAWRLCSDLSSRAV